MASTMTEIARQAGVSVSLVSRVLRGDESVKLRPATRRKILNAHDQLGGVKRQIVPLDRETVAPHILVPVNRAYADGASFSSVPFSSQTPILTGMEPVIEENGGHVSISLFDLPRKHQVIGKLMEPPRRYNGILLLTGMVDPPLLDMIRQQAIPHVSIDPYAMQLELHDVHRDVLGGMREALVHLQSLGHQRIAYVGTRKDRYSRFLAALVETRLAIDLDLTCWLEVATDVRDAATWRDMASQQFERWLAARRDFTAVVCQNDYIAFGVMEAARRAGFTIGQDLSVIGFDNVERHNPAYAFEPGLTTIDSAYDEIGQRCARSLVEQIRGQRQQIIHERVLIHLIMRRTTGPTPGRQASAAPF